MCICLFYNLLSQSSVIWVTVLPDFVKVSHDGGLTRLLKADFPEGVTQLSNLSLLLQQFTVPRTIVHVGESM